MSRTPHRAAGTHEERPPKPPKPPRIAAVMLYDRAPRGWHQQAEWSWYRARVEGAGLVLGPEPEGVAVLPWVPALFEAPYGAATDADVERFLRFMAASPRRTGALLALIALVTPGFEGNKDAVLAYARHAWTAWEDLDDGRDPETIALETPGVLRGLGVFRHGRLAQRTQRMQLTATRSTRPRTKGTR